MDGRDLLLELRTRLIERADPARAAAQQAYMKSSMPYHGVTNPQVTALCKDTFSRYPFASAAAWRADALGIWRGATHREERYAALELTGHRKARVLQGLRATPRAEPPPDAPRLAAQAMVVYEELVVTGAWWDMVDVVASNRIGPLLHEHRALVAPIMRQWIAGDDLWKRRAAIICQIGLGADTDTVLLMEAIEPALPEKVFWLRKAIGWALRAYARTDPDWVRATVEDLGPRLSGLSRREALKHL
ncbi:MAG: DNA alkylation repair protein [Myxococcota bacterium]